MDFQHRVGHRTGSGAPATAQDLALDRKERLRRLALETIDLSKDPYLMRNHVGQYECRLCLTLHANEASYLSHTQVRLFEMLIGSPESWTLWPILRTFRRAKNIRQI